MERKLTQSQTQALLQAEDTLFGDTKLPPWDGRVVYGLKKRGLVEGEAPHLYLTDTGKAELVKLATAH